MKFKKDVQQVSVLGVYRAVYPDKLYKGDDYFFTEPKSELEFSLEGIVGDRHVGFEAISGGRGTSLYQRGTSMRNNRQWSAISPAEIGSVGKKLGVQGSVTPEVLGINLLLEGIEHLSDLPSMTYMVFSPYDRFVPGRIEDVTLVVYAGAIPCDKSGIGVALALGDPSLRPRFPAASVGQRGTTGWVEKGGIIRPGHHGFILTPRGID